MRRFHVWKSSLGWMGAVVDDGKKLRRLVLPMASRGRVLKDLGLLRSGTIPVYPPKKLTAAMERYILTGVWRAPYVPEPERGTPFQRRVWRETMKIPRGGVRTYGWLAGRLGLPGGARAVGQALGANPLPLVVPCHRVTSAGGGLGGFGGGLALKRLLLRLEGVEG